MAENSADFVLVGAGSAGCLLVKRHPADPKTCVFLLETEGRDRTPLLHFPAGYSKANHNPRVDWCDETEADPGLNGRRVEWQHGQMPGGASCKNGLLYVRGQPQDHDRGRQINNEGWPWDDVRPLFKHAERTESDADTFSAFTLSACQLRPESKREIKLASKAPRVDPKTVLNSRSTETDCRTIVDGMKAARRIEQHVPFSSKTSKEFRPNPHLGMDDDEGTFDRARNNTESIYHSAGTCKRGKDDGELVDAPRRVHGGTGLRVADCSIMPVIAARKGNGPAIMITGKAADLILEDAQHQGGRRGRRLTKAMHHSQRKGMPK